MTQAGDLNFGIIKDAVIKALDRDDEETRSLMTVWARFAQAEIYSSLRAPWMVRDGLVIFENEIEELPPSWIAPLGVTLLAVGIPQSDILLLSAGGTQVLSAGPAAVLSAGGLVSNAFKRDRSVRLQQIGPEQFSEYDYADGRDPEGYLITGHVMRIMPWPGKNVGLRLQYYSSGTPIVDDTDRNEIIHHLPSALVYGILRHAAIHFEIPDGERRWSTAMADAVASANGAARDWAGTGHIMTFARPYA